jgi:hypothetical protein
LRHRFAGGVNLVDPTAAGWPTACAATPSFEGSVKPCHTTRPRPGRLWRGRRAAVVPASLRREALGIPPRGGRTRPRAASASPHRRASSKPTPWGSWRRAAPARGEDPRPSRLAPRPGTKPSARRLAPAATVPPGFDMQRHSSRAAIRSEHGSMRSKAATPARGRPTSLPGRSLLLADHSAARTRRPTEFAAWAGVIGATPASRTQT